MKKTKLLLILTLFWLVCLNAQVYEEEIFMTNGLNNALVIIISDTDDKLVEKLWQKYMKSNGAKAKKIKKSEEWFSDNANISGLNADEVDVYATFEQSGDDVRMAVWFDLGGNYLSSISTPDHYSAGERVLNDFEALMHESKVKSGIKKEQNNLVRMELSLKKILREKDRYEREIRLAKERIAIAEANIETNLIEQEEMNTMIEEQKRLLEKAKEKLDNREN